VITIQAPEFARLKSEADKFDRAIILSLRRRLKAIAQVGVDAVKRALEQEPVNDQPGTAGSRQAVADATRAVVSFSGRSGGVKITATNARLAPGHKGFAGAYEKKVLRHPVFGSSTWVGQPTRPYFGAVLVDALEDRGEKEMLAAIDDAVRAFGGRVL